ncbi:hypothetical protein H2203_009094 [Taxawa tesnikishii (nom. ined.)]|nr:hypothetical protein H2203_009094 [Dothideales sp. JES 119]
MLSFGNRIAALVLAMSSLVAAAPEPWTKYKSSSSGAPCGTCTDNVPTPGPTAPTCPASTPFTTSYITTIPSVYTSMSGSYFTKTTVITTTTTSLITGVADYLVTGTSYITSAVPTVYTLPRSCPDRPTTTLEPSNCPFNTATCITLACVSLTTVTARCPTATDPCCTNSALQTAIKRCPTACPSGCATWTETVQPPCATVMPTPTPY